MSNMIPGLYVEGSFTAKPPFTLVVNPEVCYTVEALRTVDEIRGANVNVYSMMFEPVGILEEEAEAILEELDRTAGVVIVLTSTGNKDVYLPSSYLLAFPSVDGTKYEHMAMIVDLGAVPPQLRNVLAETQQEIQDLVLSRVGVDNNVHIGVVPTTAYVEAGQTRSFENARKNKIIDAKTNIKVISELQAQVAKQEAYIQVLQDKIIELTT